MSNSPIDTVDWQRGIVSADILLTSQPAGSASYQAALPPNAATIVIMLDQGETVDVQFVAGDVTGFNYPVTRIDTTLYSGSAKYYVVDLSSAADSYFDMQLTSNSIYPWYVIASSEHQLVVMPRLNAIIQEHGSPLYPWGLNVSGSDGVDSLILSVDSNGRQIPLVPTVGKLSTVAAGTTQLLAAPASGAYYLFGVDVSEAGASSAPCSIIDSLGNTIAYDDPPAAGESHSINLSGFRTTGSVSVTTTVAATVVLRYATGP